MRVGSTPISASSAITCSGEYSRSCRHRPGRSPARKHLEPAPWGAGQGRAAADTGVRGVSLSFAQRDNYAFVDTSALRRFGLTNC